jgi:hypothetical protein
MGWVVNATPRLLYPRERPGTHFYGRLGGPQGRSGWVLPSCCQPAATWVNTTRYCKYSQVLLIMSENIAQTCSFETPAGSNLGEHYQIL